MDEKDITDVSGGLTKLITVIDTLVLQCPPDFFLDSHKIEYLRRAVAPFPNRSRIPIQNIMSQSYSLSQLVATLQESVQNLTQLQMLSEDEKIASSTNIRRQQYGTRHAQYGCNPQHLPNRHGSKTTLSSSPGLRADSNARRWNECYKRGALHRNPRHRCSSGAICAHAWSQMKSDETGVHSVADLENDLEPDTEAGDVREVTSDLLERRKRKNCTVMRHTWGR